MRFNDGTQNLRARLNAVQALVLLMPVGLAARPHRSQIARGEFYAALAVNVR